MPTKTEKEILYLQTDDTTDIGKEPLPIESSEIEELMKKSIEFIESS